MLKSNGLKRAITVYESVLEKNRLKYVSFKVRSW